MNPQDLKSIMANGLLSFPLADFDAQGDFNPAGYAKRLEWLAPYGASALFAAGGTAPGCARHAAAYKALGTPVYSSAVFNFIPKTAMDFYHAVAHDDLAMQHQLLRDFFMPYSFKKRRQT